MEITGGRIRITNLADEIGMVRGITFTDVVIEGPAVLVPQEGNSFNACSWDASGGTAEAITWEVDPARATVVGGVGLESCTFEGCQFTKVGFAGSAELIAQFFGASTI